jgi:hypothetical protein
MWKCSEALVEIGAEVLCFLTVVYLPTGQGRMHPLVSHCICEHQLFRMALHHQGPRAPAWLGQYHHQTKPHPLCSAVDNWRALLSTSVDYSNWSYCFGMVKHMSLTIVVPEVRVYAIFIRRGQQKYCKRTGMFTAVHSSLCSSYNEELSRSFPSSTKFAVWF